MPRDQQAKRQSGSPGSVSSQVAHNTDLKSERVMLREDKDEAHEHQTETDVKNSHRGKVCALQCTSDS